MSSIREHESQAGGGVTIGTNSDFFFSSKSDLRSMWRQRLNASDTYRVRGSFFVREISRSVFSGGKKSQKGTIYAYAWARAYYIPGNFGRIGSSISMGPGKIEVLNIRGCTISLEKWYRLALALRDDKEMFLATCPFATYIYLSRRGCALLFDLVKFCDVITLHLWELWEFYLHGWTEKNCVKNLFVRGRGKYERKLSSRFFKNFLLDKYSRAAGVSHKKKDEQHSIIFYRTYLRNNII